MENLSDDRLVTHNRDLTKNILFLEAWENGFVPWSTAASVVFRVRQLRRANPDLDDLRKNFDWRSLHAEKP
jgi:hypothetical protein